MHGARLPAAVDAARDHLTERGWAIVRDLSLGADTDRDAGHGRVVALASMFGTPSTRDGGVVWPVAPRTTRPDATFSVRAGKAGLHTDAQYRPDPEDLVCLFAVRPAMDGGHTRLLTAADAITAVEHHPRGEKILQVLAEPCWSWTTPQVFGPEEPFRASVLAEDGTIRWRADNLSPTSDVDQLTAAAVFEACSETAEGIAEFRLEAGDLLIVDNRRTMHARTAFQDPRRLLLRVRLWAHR